MQPFIEVQLPHIMRNAGRSKLSAFSWQLQVPPWRDQSFTALLEVAPQGCRARKEKTSQRRAQTHISQDYVWAVLPMLQFQTQSHVPHQRIKGRQRPCCWPSQWLSQQSCRTMIPIRSANATYCLSAPSCDVCDLVVGEPRMFQHLGYRGYEFVKVLGGMTLR